MKNPREPIAMNPTTLLLLLPATHAAAATCLQVDGGGRVLARRTVDADAPLTTTATQTPVRQVLAVPGIECLSTWLELPTRNPVQAVAAARVLVAEHVAGPVDTLHLAIAPAADDGSRQVVAVESATMQAWLDRAAALGMTPDFVVPMPMLLPSTDDASAGDTGEVVIVDMGGHWLIRGQRLAFAAEPALADQVIGERPRRVLTETEAQAAFAANALAPPIDLLQYAFARKTTRREGWPAWRRAAILAAVLVVSPLVLLAAQAIRHEVAARDLQAQANTRAREVLPALGKDADPLPPVRARLAELQAGDGFARAAAALLAAVAATDGAELDALAYADGELQATLVVPAPAALERIRTALAEAGLELAETGRRDAGDRNQYAITVRPSA
ncbi:type II secretion system protein GspL [Lysobacter sp. A289]